jgi:large subunit ribosomal protein L17
MLRNMATSFFEHETIRTTVSKAKALRPLIDRLITIAKRGDLSADRAVSAVLMNEKVAKKLVGSAATRFADRSCGFSAMVKTDLRYGDAAPMCLLQLIASDDHRSARSVPKSVDRSRRVAASRQAARAEGAQAPEAAAQAAPAETAPQAEAAADPSASDAPAGDKTEE